MRIIFIYMMRFVAGLPFFWHMDPVILSSHSLMRLVGFMVHVYLTIFVMGLTTAFRDWMDQQDKLELKGKDTEIRKFREKMKEENGNKLIIFDLDRYAIFDAYKVFILCGQNVLRPTGTLEKITAQDILKKYGVQLE